MTAFFLLVKQSCIFSITDFTMFRLKTVRIQQLYVRAIFDCAMAEQQGLLGDGHSTEAGEAKPGWSCPDPTLSLMVSFSDKLPKEGRKPLL